MKIQTYSDPGHGWAKVSLKLIKKLGISHKITPYSYIRGDYAYLEEDCDVTTLVNALEERRVKYEFRGYIGNKTSRIRNYRSYSHDKVDWNKCSAIH